GPLAGSPRTNTLPRSGAGSEADSSDRRTKQSSLGREAEPRRRSGDCGGEDLGGGVGDEDVVFDADAAEVHEGVDSVPADGAAARWMSRHSAPGRQRAIAFFSTLCTSAWSERKKPSSPPGSR